jgi:hypothetical protein
MRLTRVVSAFVVVATLTGSALAAEPLPLGQGTACVLMPEGEAKAKLGLKKRHVLACADPTGKVVRVVITRKGVVECSDTVQVASDGSTTNAEPCRSVTSAHQATVPPVVNLSGVWVTDVDSPSGPVTCLSQVGQNGNTIGIFATCDVLGQPGNFSGTGTIGFVGYTFGSFGTANIPQYGTCLNGGMSATVAPDGQSMSGTLRCNSLVVPFTARRG